MTELRPGIHRVEGRFAGRFLFQHLLVGERIALVDTGASTTPAELLFPYLRALGREPADVDYIVCTHPDTDHQGGNAAVRATAPACRLLGHRLDARWLEQPELLVAERYDGLRRDHGVHEPDGVLEELLELTGPATPLDVQLEGGELLALGAGWTVEILHTPGHSAGHLSVWDRRSATLIIADAALGRGVSYAEGGLAEAPTYTHPRPYLESLARLAALPAELLLTTHFAELRGEAVAAFLAESRRMAEDLEAVALETVERGPRPVGLAELIDAVDERYGPLPPGARASWAQPLAGHLAELEAAAKVARVREPGARVAWAAPAR